MKNIFKKHNKKKLSAIALISIICLHLIYQSIMAYKVSLDSLGEDVIIVNVNRASPFDKFFNRSTFKTKRLAQDKEAFKIANNYCNFLSNTFKVISINWSWIANLNCYILKIFHLINLFFR